MNSRRLTLERISWSKAVNDIWLAEQTFEGVARAIEAAALSDRVRQSPWSGKVRLQFVAPFVVLRR